jgi:hypothetical protein
MSNSITIGNVDTMWVEFVPEPLQATKWSIEPLDGRDDGECSDDVRLFFQDDHGNFVRVDLVGTTFRSMTKSSEFADDLYDVTGYCPE